MERETARNHVSGNSSEAAQDPIFVNGCRALGQSASMTGNHIHHCAQCSEHRNEICSNQRTSLSRLLNWRAIRFSTLHSLTVARSLEAESRHRRTWQRTAGECANSQLE